MLTRLFTTPLVHLKTVMYTIIQILNFVNVSLTVIDYQQFVDKN